MARDFDGAADRGVNDNDPIGGYPLTIVVWWEADDAHIGTLIGVCNSGSSGSAGQRLVTVNSGADNVLLIQSGEVSSSDARTGALTTGVLRHACGVVRSATDREIYTNGVSVDTDAGNIPYDASMNRVNIGNLETTTSIQFFDGKLGFMALWDVALSTDEILALAHGVNPFLIRNANLKANYPFYGNLDPEPDRSRNGFDITLTSAPPKIASAPVESLENYL